MSVCAAGENNTLAPQAKLSENRGLGRAKSLNFSSFPPLFGGMAKIILSQAFLFSQEQDRFLGAAGGERREGHRFIAAAAAAAAAGARWPPR